MTETFPAPLDREALAKVLGLSPKVKLKVLDLFSGIGGFSLGLERTDGFETVAFCEIDPFCRRVLAKHWPDVPIYEDVCTLTAGHLAADGIVPDVICGGFPCQDISVGGNAAGITGDRSGLWRHYFRLISEIRPQFVLVENVAALLGRGLGDVLGDLAAIGYDAEWHCIPATALGACHRRDRVWIVAYPEALRWGEGLRSEARWGRSVRDRLLGGASAWLATTNNHEIRSEFVRVLDGVPHHVDRLATLGNAVVPQIPELIGRAILEARSSA